MLLRFLPRSTFEMNVACKSAASASAPCVMHVSLRTSRSAALSGYPMLDPRQIEPLVDYVHNQRFVDAAQDPDQDRSCWNSRLLGWSDAGRTLSQPTCLPNVHFTEIGSIQGHMTKNTTSTWSLARSTSRRSRSGSAPSRSSTSRSSSARRCLPVRCRRMQELRQGYMQPRIRPARRAVLD